MKKLVFLLLAVFAMQSCLDDDGCEMACFTDPQPFFFEIVDATTGENLFTNGTYTEADIDVYNTLNNNNSVTYSFISEDDLNLLTIHSIGWVTETVDLDIQLADVSMFSLYVDAERISEDCCSFTRYNEVEITNTTFEYDAETGIYTIFVEQ
ncbi:hypothetical protein SAMN05216480_105106 [Pustulibacterium marinum]|uniref:Uncharacterized protein n=1 Tax=Pustulibacterium marinum TaxID=1224947 RepID=A0A1I7GNE6_9FLAO|nr:hypothetical protein [Pustulibacterium marinum]SFU49851.1 hypothetical protein SAMN05216480_105106 [Pustulibacterium marinum]